MEKKVIMLACAAGMSTSLLVSKMQKAATEKGFDAEIFAVAAAEAHHTQTEMLTQEANGDSVEVSLLMVHGQDHLMTGMMFKDLAKEIVDVYRTIRKEQ